MNRVAVFVDAGYLLSQGSVALVGMKQPRSGLLLREQTLLPVLKTFALACDPGTSLLRIYWYDGLVGRRETPEQRRLADSPDLKLRMGTVNSEGDQKGVDSLIVTDLVDLARAGAIVSAVVLSGDEDVRIGVEIAQRYGVRVHLLGIVPSRGSQSPDLLREADTTTEWDTAMVGTFLSVPNPVSPPPLASTGMSVAVPTTVLPGFAGAERPRAQTSVIPALDATTKAALQQAVSLIAGTLAAGDIPDVVAGWDAKQGIEYVVDSRLLAQARTSLGRELEPNEKRLARQTLVEHLKTLLP